MFEYVKFQKRNMKTILNITFLRKYTFEIFDSIISLHYITIVKPYNQNIKLVLNQLQL